MYKDLGYGHQNLSPFVQQSNNSQTENSTQQQFQLQQNSNNQGQSISSLEKRVGFKLDRANSNNEATNYGVLTLKSKGRAQTYNAADTYNFDDFYQDSIHQQQESQGLNGYDNLAQNQYSNPQHISNISFSKQSLLDTPRAYSANPQLFVDSDFRNLFQNQQIDSDYNQRYKQNKSYQNLQSFQQNDSMERLQQDVLGNYQQQYHQQDVKHSLKLSIQQYQLEDFLMQNSDQQNQARQPTSNVNQLHRTLFNQQEKGSQNSKIPLSGAMQYVHSLTDLNTAHSTPNQYGRNGTSLHQQETGQDNFLSQLQATEKSFENKSSTRFDSPPNLQNPIKNVSERNLFSYSEGELSKYQPQSASANNLKVIEDNDFLSWYGKENIPKASNQDELFREDNLPEPIVLSQYLESGIEIELNQITQAQVQLPQVLFIVPLRALRFIWIGSGEIPVNVRSKIQFITSQSQKVHNLQVQLHFEHFINGQETYLTLEKAQVCYGLRDFMKHLGAFKGDTLKLFREPLENFIRVEHRKSKQHLQIESESQTYGSAPKADGDIFDSLVLSNSLKKHKFNKFQSAKNSRLGRLYDVNTLPIITDLSELLLEECNIQHDQQENNTAVKQSTHTSKSQSTESNQKSNRSNKKYVKCESSSTQNSDDEEYQQMLGPIDMRVNQERCQIEFQPSNQVSDFITPLKARGFRWAGQGQPPKSVSVKIVIVDDVGEQWHMTHILKFHKNRGPLNAGESGGKVENNSDSNVQQGIKEEEKGSQYPVMRFKISNFLGWRRFNKRWHVQKGDKLIFYKSPQTGKTYLNLIRKNDIKELDEEELQSENAPGSKSQLAKQKRQRKAKQSKELQAQSNTGSRDKPTSPQQQVQQQEDSCNAYSSQTGIPQVQSEQNQNEEFQNEQFSNQQYQNDQYKNDHYQNEQFNSKQNEDLNQEQQFKIQAQDSFDQRMLEHTPSLQKVFNQLQHEDSFEPRAFLMQTDLPSMLDRTVTNLSEFQIDDVLDPMSPKYNNNT